MKKCRNIDESYEEKLLDNNSESLNGHDVMQLFNFLYLINHLNIDAKYNQIKRHNRAFTRSKLYAKNYEIWHFITNFK